MKAQTIKNIINGWGNSFLDKVNLLPANKKQVAEDRLDICMNCPIRTNDVCDPSKHGIGANGVPFEGCGCFIEKKVFCMDCSCPGLYWTEKNL